MNLLRIPQTVQNIQRFRQVAGIVAEYGFAEILIQAGLIDGWAGRGFHRTRAAAAGGDAPQRFAHMLERLGTSFVKLGQILSTRADLLPDAWIAALSRLQENVAPIPYDDVRALIDAVGAGAAFVAIDETPLASASVGQVHAAQLADGAAAVIKVVRPGIRGQVAADVELMRTIATLLEERIPDLRAFRPTGVIDEFERAITRELDLKREARNIERFRRNFAGDERVVIPRVWHELGSRDVLVMERMRGVKVTEYAQVGNDPAVLARLGIDVILKMTFFDGFFHADPHPGNIWTLPGNRLALLDMGMADFVLPDTRDLIVDLLFAVATDDPDQMVRAVYRLGSQPEDLDGQGFQRDIMSIYEDHVAGARLSDIQVGVLIADCIEAARRHHIVIPTDITMMLKALGTVEGIGKQLDPQLDLIAEARPHVLKLVGLRWGPDRVARRLVGAATETFELAVSLPRRFDEVLRRVERGTLRGRLEVEGLSVRLLGVEQAGNRVAVALLVLALTIAGVALWQRPLVHWRGLPIDGVVILLSAAGLGALTLFRAWRSARQRP